MAVQTPTSSTTARFIWKRAARLFSHPLLERYMLLWLIMWVGAWLRFYRLGDWSFWIDELFTVQNGDRLFAIAAPVDLATAVVEHPTTAVLVQIAAQLFGLSEWSARLPVAILGVLTIPVLYAVAARLLNRRVGLTAAFLLAISPWHIYWSQNSRFYAPMLLFYTLSIFFLYRAIYRWDGRFLLLGIAFFVWALSERLVAMLLLPATAAHFLLLFVFKWARPRSFRPGGALAFLLGGGLLGIGFGWEFLQNPDLIADIYGRWQGAASLGLMRSHVSYVDTLTVGLAVLGVGCLWRQKRPEVIWLGAHAVVPVMLLAIVGNFVFVNVRYTFISLTAWFILAGVVVDVLWTKMPRDGRPLLLGVCCLLLVYGPARENRDYFASTDGIRNNWRAAFEFLEPELAEPDLVAVSKPLLGEYYLQRDILSMQPVDVRIRPENIDHEKGRIWFVIGGRSRISPATLAWVQQHASLVYTNDKNMFVYVYDPP